MGPQGQGAGGEQHRDRAHDAGCGEREGHERHQRGDQAAEAGELQHRGEHHPREQPQRGPGGPEPREGVPIEREQRAAHQPLCRHLTQVPGADLRADSLQREPADSEHRPHREHGREQRPHGGESQKAQHVVDATDTRHPGAAQQECRERGPEGATDPDPDRGHERQPRHVGHQRRGEQDRRKQAPPPAHEAGERHAGGHPEQRRLEHRLGGPDDEHPRGKVEQAHDGASSQQGPIQEVLHRGWEPNRTSPPPRRDGAYSGSLKSSADQPYCFILV